jgi:hypothetical protein
VGIFDFEGDRLMCEKVCFDMATLMRQLQGLRKVPRVNEGDETLVPYLLKAQP